MFMGREEGHLELEELERVPEHLPTSGDVRVEAISPDEFSLELRSVGSLGHFEASVRLGRYQYSGPTYWPTMIAGGFEIEPSQLQSILAAFQALLLPQDAS